MEAGFGVLTEDYADGNISTDFDFDPCVASRRELRMSAGKPYE